MFKICWVESMSREFYFIAKEDAFKYSTMHDFYV